MKSSLITVGFTRLSKCGSIGGQQRTFISQFSTPLWLRAFSSSAASDNIEVAKDNSVEIEYHNGLPVFTLLLPSRTEKCRFTMRPVSQTIGDFTKFIMTEDKGVDRVAFYHEDGTRLSSSTYIEQLLQLPRFSISVNNRSLSAAPPPLIAPDTKLEDLGRLSEVKSLIASLHSSLNIEEHKIGVERRLSQRREELIVELAPLAKQKQQILDAAERSTTRLLYLGLGLMGAQFGFLARLTWFEYSWDIMEPITYFTTYGTVIAGFAYYVTTRTSYEYPLARDRQFWILFHRKARKSQFDAAKHDRLVEELRVVNSELQRLRDPLFLHLPIGRLQSLHGTLLSDTPTVAKEDVQQRAASPPAL